MHKIYDFNRSFGPFPVAGIRTYVSPKRRPLNMHNAFVRSPVPPAISHAFAALCLVAINTARFPLFRRLLFLAIWPKFARTRLDRSLAHLGIATVRIANEFRPRWEVENFS